MTRSPCIDIMDLFLRCKRNNPETAACYRRYLSSLKRCHNPGARLFF